MGVEAGDGNEINDQSLVVPQNCESGDGAIQEDIANAESGHDGASPSITYQTLVYLGMLLLIFDMASDLVTAILNIAAKRYEQGVLSIILIIIPMIFHCNSHIYTTQEGLIPMQDAYSDEYMDEQLKCKTWLLLSLFDPIIWAYNHYVQTKEYRKNQPLDGTRKRFYFTKQMAQMSLKNEARIEATWQAKLTFFGFLYYHEEYYFLTKVVIVLSLLASAFSMGRAYCSDLQKTQKKFAVQDYPDQNYYWKFFRLLSAFVIAIAIVISHGSFIFYATGFLFQYSRFFRVPYWLCILLAFITVFLISTYARAFWYYYIGVWLGKHPTPITCSNIFKRISGETVDLYINRSPNPAMYSLSCKRHSVLFGLDLIELVVLLVPMILTGEEGNPYFADLLYIFTSCILLGSLATIITRLIKTDNLLQDSPQEQHSAAEQ